MIRYSTMNMSAITATADKIIDVKRRLSRYVRDSKKAEKVLIEIAKNKKKKGRTFGAYKDSDIIGGFNSRWSAVELNILLFALIFTNIYGNILRFDFNANILSASNINVIHRVWNELICEEELDIVFLSDIKSRAPKSIKDKLTICGEYAGDDKHSTVAKIQMIINDKFNYQKNKKNKEPSSGL